MRAHAADGSGEREGLVDGLDGVLVAALADLAHVLLAVGHGRAVELAGPAAVAGVVREQKLQRGLARTVYARGVQVDDVALLRTSRASAQQLGHALDLDEADAAGAVDGRARVKAQGGNLDSSPSCGRENGVGRFRNHFHTVDGVLDGHDVPPPSYLTWTAPKRQAVLQFPHLMQSAGSISCGLLRSPEMACTGHCRAHAVQPTHTLLSIE